MVARQPGYIIINPHGSYFFHIQTIAFRPNFYYAAAALNDRLAPRGAQNKLEYADK